MQSPDLCAIQGEAIVHQMLAGTWPKACRALPAINQGITEVATVVPLHGAVGQTRPTLQRTVQLFQFLAEPGQFSLDPYACMLHIVDPGNDLRVCECRVQRAHHSEQRLWSASARTARRATSAQRIAEPTIGQSLRRLEPAIAPACAQ
ncbi:hypothetical protein D3C80_1022990 [compost metagenome]